jgi:5-histidylcysteine sulfoxide synthase/putative 4-mercaptohistidine N1-methyltranferase
VSLNAGRKALLDYFNNGWALTEVLFSALVSEEAFHHRPYHKLRHPMIFYYVHPVALYVNKLRVAGLLDGPVNAHFEQLFETGVDEMRWDDLHEGNQDIWPPLKEVHAYRRQVYGILRDLIETHPLVDRPITQESPLWALVMGFEHERIHLETSSVLMRELPIDYVCKPEGWPDFLSLKTASSKVPTLAANPFIDIAGGNVDLGKPSDWLSFGWDNEYGAETRYVASFRASKCLVSNAEFYAFVTGGGYANQDYWSAEGWAWRGFHNIKHPNFWVPQGPAGLHHYRLRTIFEIVPMQWDWPICVNFHEAKAYLSWKTQQDNAEIPYRLLTEAEHNALRDNNVDDPVMRQKGGGFNFNLVTGGESPVTAFTANAKGFHDVFGNVWQWCEDHFHPLEGSKAHPYYDDFSLPCYDGEHQMILGGSFISTGDEASKFSRFHFRPHFFQHAGFRIAQSVGGDASGKPKLIRKQGQQAYQTSEMLNRYMLMHWGADEEIYDAVLYKDHYPRAVRLPLACAGLVWRFSKSFGRALDLGCAVGRSSFEMTRDFGEVVGVDYSPEFIRAAQALQDKGELDYWRKDQGNKGVTLTARVDSAIDRSRLSFEQGDACRLAPHLHGFDAVLMANVLCRLDDPQACLRRMQGSQALVKDGGVLVMTTPFSWLEKYTPPSRWINGVGDIASILTEFECIHEEDLPFLIREHRRKFAYIITHASVWRKSKR